MMRWWLDRGVDGFRMDVVNFISKDPALPDGHPMPGSLLRRRRRRTTCPVRVSTSSFRRCIARCSPTGQGPLLTVGEMPGVTVDEARLYTDPARSEVDMVFQFEHVGLDQGDRQVGRPRRFDCGDLKASFGRWQVGLSDVGWNSLYWNNHDQPRVVSRFGDDGEHRVRAAKMLATVLHLHRGTPYVYQGEELGMTNAPFASVEDFRDIESLNHYRSAVAAGADPERVLDSLRAMSRDNARTPMQWNSSPHAGFTTGTPWIAVNPNHREINVAAELAEPDSVLHHYRRLIELRHTEPVVALGEFTMLLPDDRRVYAFLRRLDDVELLVLGNFSATAVDADVPEAAAWAHSELLVRNYPAEPASAGESITLRPWETRVYRRSTGSPG